MGCLPCFFFRRQRGGSQRAHLGVELFRRRELLDQLLPLLLHELALLVDHLAVVVEQGLLLDRNGVKLFRRGNIFHTSLLHTRTEHGGVALHGLDAVGVDRRHLLDRELAFAHVVRKLMLLQVLNFLLQSGNFLVGLVVARVHLGEGVFRPLRVFLQAPLHLLHIRGKMLNRVDRETSGFRELLELVHQDKVRVHGPLVARRRCRRRKP